MKSTQEFDQALDRFISGARKIMNENHDNNGYTFPKDILITTKGRRYTKVIRRNSDGSGGSVHCFIDKNGDVLKAASWKIPAKHARGNIFDEHNGLAAMTPYGAVYLR